MRIIIVLATIGSDIADSENENGANSKNMKGEMSKLEPLGFDNGSSAKHARQNQLGTIFVLTFIVCVSNVALYLGLWNKLCTTASI